MAAERTSGLAPKPACRGATRGMLWQGAAGPNREAELSKSRKMKLSDLPASFARKPRNLHAVRSPSRAGDGPFRASKGIALAGSAGELDRQPLAHEVRSICEVRFRWSSITTRARYSLTECYNSQPSYMSSSNVASPSVTYRAPHPGRPWDPHTR